LRFLQPISPALGLWLMCGSALAQGPSASESYVQLSSALLAAGAATSGSLYQAEEGLAYTLPGEPSSSESYSAQGGIVWIDPAPLGPGPVLLSVFPSTGSKTGGETVQLMGTGFAAPAAGATSVRFGSAPAAGIAVLGDTRIDAVTPAGLNLYGNPLGAVEVELENQLGLSSLPSGFAYLPALTQPTPAHVGGTLVLDHTGTPGGFWIMVWGLPIPGVALPIPPLQGALEPLQSLNVLVSLAPLGPSGQGQFGVPIPASPGLAGKQIFFQAADLSSLVPLAGSFTNMKGVSFLP